MIRPCIMGNGRIIFIPEGWDKFTYDGEKFHVVQGSIVHVGKARPAKMVTTHS